MKILLCDRPLTCSTVSRPEIQKSCSSLKFKEKRIVVIRVPKRVTDFKSKLVEGDIR